MTRPSFAPHDRSSGRHVDSSGIEGRVVPDVLSHVLQDLRLTGASYCLTDMAAPWGIEIAAAEGPVFHFIVEGSCWLRSTSGEPLRLGRGDLVLLAHGSGHTLVDAPASAARPLEDLRRERVGDSAFRLHGAGSGSRALLVCCAVAFEASALHPLLWMMPEVLHVASGGGYDVAVAALLDTMRAEAHQQRMGAASIMARLADIVVTRIVRAW